MDLELIDQPFLGHHRAEVLLDVVGLPPEGPVERKVQLRRVGPLQDGDGRVAGEREQVAHQLEALGPLGVLTEGSPHAVKGGNAALSYLIMRAATIGGGTSEIQRNLIGERVLGLPRG